MISDPLVSIIFAYESVFLKTKLMEALLIQMWNLKNFPTWGWVGRKKKKSISEITSKKTSWG